MRTREAVSMSDPGPWVCLIYLLVVAISIALYAWHDYKVRRSCEWRNWFHKHKVVARIRHHNRMRPWDIKGRWTAR